MTKKSLLSWGQLLAAVPAGAIATLSFAPYNYWLLAPLSLIAFFFLLQHKTAKRSALIGFLYGLGMFGTGISWVHVSIDNFGGMPKIASVFLMTMLISYLALYPALYGYLYNRFNRTRPFHQLLLTGPVFWLLLDWIRGWLFTGFPWLWMGYSQIDTPLAAIAPIFGVEGITLALVLISGAIVAAITYRNWKPLLIPIVIIGLSLWAGKAQWVKPDPKNSVSVALIQGNIPQDQKWLPSQRWPTLMKYMDLTRENWGSDLIIWPEAAIPALEAHIPVFLQGLDDAARANNSTVITGILDQKPDGQFFNNILTLGVDADGPYNYDTATRYSKHHLLPFGEFVPFGNLLRPIAPLFNLPMSSFSRGAYVQPNIQAHGYSIAPALCYEVAFSEQMRENITNHTEMLLTLSNDAWFGRSIGPFQHMEIAQMRALELGKPLLRATNTGITAVVNHEGHITKKLPQFVTGVLKATVIPTIGMTPYTTLGSWPLYFYSFWAFALSWILIRRQRGHFRDTRPLETE
ncbi:MULTISPECIES: apolipoprotein N-acyltransferase [unclassified Photobacterium]|uniref:apolipoprotein N-acyltransferase n=1 Tax=unclassified Photobacterium TaxID=2628852 RepID=UPI001EDCA2F0|nr:MULTISPECIES: apolipoprotein N-acyltransferase [unclassified Photobacterium]MCG3865125.1 apolipoprotein N-acyltransferase [Photobacterium sp. Ph6]MCG3876496.1 apolipoprotein N-acyltransferase [Photobacterium sp. Ph5]